MPTGIYQHKKHKTSEATKLKISLAQKGRKFTEEHKQKLSLAKKGKTSVVLGKHWKIKDTSKMHHPSWLKGIKYPYVIWNKGKKGLQKHSEETRRKMSESRKNIFDLRGRRTPINKLIRASKEYKLWREAVFKRDNYTCIWCGDNKGGNLNADHIQFFSLFPELRFAIDNGRTLCENCHIKRHTRYE